MGTESCPQVGADWLPGTAVSVVCSAQHRGELTPVSDKPSVGLLQKDCDSVLGCGH